MSEVWNGFQMESLVFEGQEACVVFPHDGTANGRLALKTVYWNAFPGAVEVPLLERGFHLCFVKNETRWGRDEDLAREARFVRFVAQTYNLNERSVPVGMSCGGLIGSKFAAKYPECVSALYLDAPVMNFLSCPAGLGVAEKSLYEEFYKATGMTISELLSYRENPIDKMHLLLENKIPVVMVYGDSDVVVPYVENGAILEKYYRENGGVIETYGKPGCGHHPHGLPDSTPIIAFVEKHCK